MSRQRPERSSQDRDRSEPRGLLATAGRCGRSTSAIWPPSRRHAVTLRIGNASGFALEACGQLPKYGCCAGISLPIRQFFVMPRLRAKIGKVVKVIGHLLVPSTIEGSAYCRMRYHSSISWLQHFVTSGFCENRPRPGLLPTPAFSASTPKSALARTASEVCSPDISEVP